MNYSRQRELILHIVKGTDVHPTAEWVYQEAKKVIPTIGIATVYRNLNALAEMGECQKIAMADGTDRFDGTTDRHFHMKCRCCGRLIDLNPTSVEALERLETMAREIFGKEEESAGLPTILLEGFCEECKEKMKDEEKWRN
ncbi:MAG: transcriptional repressor [Firmicutes bacterium]|jgi:Fur family peroxide stress response transcriptional regulator|nr:transcriptional repressor [Bacillota bacterium]